MSLDVTVKVINPITCPECGTEVYSELVAEIMSGGRKWYPFIEGIGYYSYENDQCKWYGKDMLLSECNARKLLEYLELHEVFARWEIYEAVLKSLREGWRVYINADW